MTEIRLAVQFLASHLYSKIPRRKVDLFTEHLVLLFTNKYSPQWNPYAPLEGAQNRVIPVNFRGLTDNAIILAADAVALNPNELLWFLPMELMLWVNPDDVCYRVGFGPLMQLFKKKAMLGGLLPFARPTDLPAPWTTLEETHFTTGSFAMTRFGSTKIKPNLEALVPQARSSGSSPSSSSSLSPPSQSLLSSWSVSPGTPPPNVAELFAGMSLSS